MAKKELTRLRTVRVKNLRQEVSRRRKKGEKTLHDLLGVSRARFSQIVNEHVAITDATARKIEDAFEMEPYSLDALPTRAFIFLKFDGFNFEEGKDKTVISDVIEDINSVWSESNRPIVRLDYILGEWDAVIEVKCLYIEQIKELISAINTDKRSSVAKSNTLISFGETESFL